MNFAFVDLAQCESPEPIEPIGPDVAHPEAMLQSHLEALLRPLEAHRSR